MHGAVFRALCILVDKSLVQTRATMTVTVIVLEAATVPSIPVASAVVIFVVTVFVLNPSLHLAWLTALGLLFVQASAFSTVQKRFRCYVFVCFCTTVTAVPVATALVVAVVTVAITLPRLDFALGYAVVVAFEEGVTTAAI